jgi:hypothetical protein
MVSFVFISLNVNENRELWLLVSLNIELTQQMRFLLVIYTFSIFNDLEKQKLIYKICLLWFIAGYGFASKGKSKQNYRAYSLQ